MKDTTLKSLSEIVDITADMAYDGNFITNHIWDYNEFLKTPLSLFLFIPCKDGVPLEEPERNFTGAHDNTFANSNYHLELKEYKQALDRVIFKGFELLSEVKDKYLISNEDAFEIIIYKNGNFWEYKQISDLEGKVQLVDKEYKRLGL